MRDGKHLPVKNKATKLSSEHGIQSLSQSGNTATVTNKTVKKEMYGVTEFHMNLFSASLLFSRGSNLVRYNNNFTQHFKVTQ